MKIITISKPIKEKDNQNIWNELQAFRDKHRLDELDIDTDLFDIDRKHEKERAIEKYFS